MRALWLLAVTACGHVNFDTPDATGGGGECPVDYKVIYGVKNWALSPVQPASAWVQAFMTCHAVGADLAAPRSRYEALVLAEHYQIAAWTGISQVNSPGVWSLASGVAASYLPWDPGNSEPNGTGECAILMVDGVSASHPRCMHRCTRGLATRLRGVGAARRLLSSMPCPRFRFGC